MGPSSVIPTKPIWVPTISPPRHAPKTGLPWAPRARSRAGITILSSPQTRSIRAAASLASCTEARGRISVGSSIRQEVVHQAGDHLGPAGHLVHHDVLVTSVRASADGAEPIESGDAQGGGEVSVAGSADLRRSDLEA